MLPVIRSLKHMLLYCRTSLSTIGTDNQQKVYLHDFLADNGVYEIGLQVKSFTLLHMDGDDMPEVILELSVGISPEFHEVFHYD